MALAKQQRRAAAKAAKEAAVVAKAKLAAAADGKAKAKVCSPRPEEQPRPPEDEVVTFEGDSAAGVSGGASAAGVAGVAGGPAALPRPPEKEVAAAQVTTAALVVAAQVATEAAPAVGSAPAAALAVVGEAAPPDAEALLQLSEFLQCLPSAQRRALRFSLVDGAHAQAQKGIKVPAGCWKAMADCP